jgi:hypothetical protein
MQQTAPIAKRLIIQIHRWFGQEAHEAILEPQLSSTALHVFRTARTPAIQHSILGFERPNLFNHPRSWDARRAVISAAYFLIRVSSTSTYTTKGRPMRSSLADRVWPLKASQVLLGRDRCQWLFCLFDIRLMQFHRFGLAAAGTDVQDFDNHTEGHRKVNVALRNFRIEGLGDQ